MLRGLVLCFVITLACAWALQALAQETSPDGHRSHNGCGICCALAGGTCRDRYWIPPYMVRHQCPSEAYPCEGGDVASTHEPAVGRREAPATPRVEVTRPTGNAPGYILSGAGIGSSSRELPPGRMPYTSRNEPSIRPAIPPPYTGKATPCPSWPPYNIVPRTRGAMDEATALRLAPPVPAGTVAPQTFADASRAFLAKNEGDCFVYTGPFLLERTPILAEHKFPMYFGCSMRVIPRLRLYPFLAFNVLVPTEDEPVRVASNFVFNSLPIPGDRALRVEAGHGLGYVEQHTAEGVAKYMVLRLRDDTIKITRLDADGRGVYAVYTIAGRPWAIFAHRFIDTTEPATPTILLEELTHPRESYALRKLLAGFENASYYGYWTIPQDDRLAGWGDIQLMRDARKLSGDDWSGQTVIRPLDVGHFDILFEEGLTYTEPGYHPPRKWNIPLPYPAEPGEQLPAVRPATGSGRPGYMRAFD